jgi:chromosome segregation ATPase
MKGFKSSESRLVRLFKNSREQWKQRAADKQKKLRAMEVKVRDLSASREHWKERALKAEQQQRQLQKELEILKKKVSSRN